MYIQYVHTYVTGLGLDLLKALAWPLKGSYHTASHLLSPSFHSLPTPCSPPVPLQSSPRLHSLCTSLPSPSLPLPSSPLFSPLLSSPLVPSPLLRPLPPDVASAWLETGLQAVERLPRDVVKREFLPLTASMGHLSQGVESRLLACKLCGALVGRFEPFW